MLITKEMFPSWVTNEKQEIQLSILFPRVDYMESRVVAEGADIIYRLTIMFTQKGHTIDFKDQADIEKIITKFNIYTRQMEGN